MSNSPSRTATGRTFWTPRAWIGGGWQENVSLQIGDEGRWARVQAGTTPDAHATVLAGPVLPGLVNAHSHAFQRAFAGLAERRDLDQDDFWSWRDGMYRTALRITPELQRAIAAQLFLELARGGFTHVCEFHYLHNDGEGRPIRPIRPAWRGPSPMPRARSGSA
jgi:formimidoylglutamate deiminase